MNGFLIDVFRYLIGQTHNNRFQSKPKFYSGFRESER